MHSVFHHVAARGLVVTVPKRHIDIEDELAFFDNNPKKLARARKILGYGRRHVVPNGVTTLDLCEHAARALLRDMHWDVASIDALVLVNQSPDYVHPAGACILQHRLGLSTECAALDTSLGCSGYVYGLWLAHALIGSGSCKTVLLCAGDTPSIHSSTRNRRVNPLFGDAGSATLLERTEEENAAWFDLGTDGSGWHHIAVPAGGARLRITPDMLERDIVDDAGNPWRLCDALIDGKPVFDFSVSAVPRTVDRVLAQAGKKLSDMDFIALHQANRQIIEEISLRLGLTREALHSGTFSRYGNQSTASVAGVLCDSLCERMNSGSLTVLLCGFGVGFSWASAILRFAGCYNGGVLFHDTPPASQKVQASFWKRHFLQEKA